MTEPTLPRMRPAEREAWILDYIAKRDITTSYRYRVNVLDAAFVDAYIDATRAPFRLSPFGAFWCPTLGRDLGRMYVAGKLDRVTTGIGDGLSGQGFPRWVWNYSANGPA